jgi:hypothetical protein
MICNRCGATVASGNVWCTSCGAKIANPASDSAAQPARPKPEEKPPAPAGISSTPCKSCGQMIPSGVRFCTKCGADQSKPAPAPPEAIRTPAPPMPPSAPLPRPAPKEAVNAPAPPPPPFIPASRMPAPPPPVPPPAAAPAAVPSKSIPCISCGQPIPAGVRFCTKCGADQNNQVSMSQDTVRLPALAIPTVSPAPRPVTPAPQVPAAVPPPAPPPKPTTCFTCGQALAPGIRFCTKCGSDQNKQPGSSTSPKVAAPAPRLSETDRRATESRRHSPPSTPAGSPSAKPRSGGLGMKVWLPVIFLIIVVGAVASYYTVDSVRETVSRWLPARATTPTQTQPPAQVTEPATPSQPTTTPATPPVTTPSQPPANPPETKPPTTQPAPGASVATTKSSIPSPAKVTPAATVSREKTPTPPPTVVTPLTAVPPAAAKNDPQPKVEKPSTAVNPPVPTVTKEPEKQPPTEAAKAATQPPVVPEKKPAPAEISQVAPPIPPRGTLQWSGDVNKDQTVTIEGGTASFGSLTGKLPRFPCTVSVQSQDVSIAEAPGPSNAFDRIVLRFRKKGRISVTITWETLRQEMP